MQRARQDLCALLGYRKLRRHQSKNIQPLLNGKVVLTIDANRWQQISVCYRSMPPLGCLMECNTARYWITLINVSSLVSWRNF